MISYPHFAFPNLFLVDGYSLEQTEYGEVVSYEDEGALEACVGRLRVRAPRRLNGPELRFLRRTLGLTQDDFGALIDRNEQTVARMEKSDAPIDRSVDLVVRSRYLGQYEPCTQVGEILSIVDGVAKTPSERVLLSHANGVWTYRHDVPSFQVVFSDSYALANESAIKESLEQGFLTQRTLTVSMTLQDTSPINEPMYVDRIAVTKQLTKHSYGTK